MSSYYILTAAEAQILEALSIANSFWQSLYDQYILTATLSPRQYLFLVQEMEQ